MNVLPSSSSSRLGSIWWLLVGWIPGIVGLMIATRPCWWDTTDFPEVPFFAGLCTAPYFIDRVAWLLFLAGILGMGFAGLRRSTLAFRWLSLLAWANLSLLMLLNQHRCQPWVILSWQFLFAFVLCDSGRATVWLRRLTIAVYIYSSFTKIDHEFIHSTGQVLMGQLLHSLKAPDWLVAMSADEVWLLPMVELLVGLGLCWQMTRRTAVVLGSLMHMALLIVLGCWGLGHQPPVLIWNALAVWQLWILFWQPAIPPVELDNDKPWTGRMQDRVATVALTGLLAFPLLQPLGVVDHWFAWGLYAPRNSYARVFVRKDVPHSSLGTLASHLKPLPGQARGDLWVQADIGNWSLDQLGVPIYPDSRFQVGVAVAVGQRCPQEQQIRIEIRSQPDRMRGIREREQHVGLQAIEHRAQRYRINAQPRGMRPRK